MSAEPPAAPDVAAEEQEDRRLLDPRHGADPVRDRGDLRRVLHEHDRVLLQVGLARSRLRSREQGAEQRLRDRVLPVAAGHAPVEDGGEARRDRGRDDRRARWAGTAGGLTPRTPPPQRGEGCALPRRALRQNPLQRAAVEARDLLKLQIQIVADEETGYKIAEKKFRQNQGSISCAMLTIALFI